MKEERKLMQKNVMGNKHIGGDFKEFLKEDGIFEETNDIAIKRVIAYQLEQEMKAQKITKTKMAQIKTEASLLKNT
ncbi:hypothetical protein JWV37_03520 [Sulfurospirillum sp. T05]|uniref:Uncharacterized protein n=1 Tax=Sulfurospirillum tamanense TaxID=2813362 RepID=A0ABS2WQ72_9BACT|nr:hypothetical protein [Sulfurospirillum tamanensis]MBN2963841.1 hypothetical protein [Sulfurospirillum tamanensis]